MSIFKCKMCGGTIEFNPGDSIGICDSCGTKQTLPNLDDDRRANLYDRANHLRRNNEFDKATVIYEQILNEDTCDAEAYWSLVLCRYGIEYVEDPTTHKQVPTVNRAQFTSIYDDENYKSAIRYADSTQRSIYETEANTINEIQKGILVISNKEKPFDVFICYKETDQNGRRTLDSVLANDLYHQLKNEGFSVFFSRITLEDKLGTAYEPYIFAALNSAKVMVVIGTKPEYFNAIWVKNEWSRYLSLVKQSGGKKILIPAYRDMDPYDLPEEFSHLQAQDMSKLGFMLDLIRCIEKIINSNEESTKIKETIVVGTDNLNVSPLLERAFLFLEDGKWDDANVYCEKVLDIEPKNTEAYLGKLMADLQVKSRNELKNYPEPFDDKENYDKIIRFGDAKLKAEMLSYIAHIKERNEKARRTDIYNNAVSAMNAANTEQEIITVIEMFKTIADFQDVEIQITACQRKIEAIKEKEETERLEYKRLVEKRRIAKENAIRKCKRIIAIATPIIIACIAFVTLFKRVIIPRQKLNKAQELLNSGNYEVAYTLLEEIGNIDAITKNKYERAMMLIDSNDYEAAYTLLEEIGNTDAITKNKYERAMMLIDSEDYEDAYTLLEEIGNTEAIVSSKYEKAISLIDSNDYEAAYILLDGLNYKDSIDKLISIKPQYKKILLSKAQIGSYVMFGSYEQDNNTSNGKEDIEWLVLAKEDNKLLLISKYALDYQPYNISYTRVTWETCSLRKWLNETFLNKAFTEEEFLKIASTTVIADNNPYYNTSSGNNTIDQIFLLSIMDINKYLGSSCSCECQCTTYCSAQNSFKSYNGNCWWLLRTPGEDSNYVACVSDTGSILSAGLFVHYTNLAVRPSMWIVIEA